MPKVEIYTSSSCMYCLAAKNYLKHKGFDYEEHRVDVDPERWAELLRRSPRRSLPQVFIDGRAIGGYEDLVNAGNAGTLGDPGEDAA